jgi:selenide,water dikinase
VDFFTPIVDDPYWFGQIAAANALSDVYAMGGTPKTALNLIAFPIKEMDISVLRRIIQGGIDKLKEAEVVLIGGHSIADKELKYGLSVTGFVHPARVLIKRNIKPGDQLVLTKPLGTGIINTAVKGGLASAELVQKVTEVMAGLNKKAAQIMSKYPVNACTDITGFGLLGHLAEMVEGSCYGMRIHSAHVPLLPEVLNFASMGILPAGAQRNREFRASMVTFAPSVDPILQDVLFDPQTSGGLLISVNESKAEHLLDELKGHDIQTATIIGEIVLEPQNKIIVE